MPTGPFACSSAQAPIVTQTHLRPWVPGRLQAEGANPTMGRDDPMQRDQFPGKGNAQVADRRGWCRGGMIVSAAQNWESGK